VVFREPKNSLWKKSPNRLRHVKNHRFLSTIRIPRGNSKVYGGVGDFANFYDFLMPWALSGVSFTKENLV